MNGIFLMSFCALVASTPPAELQQPTPRIESQWYGWQILIGDLVSTGMLAGGVFLGPLHPVSITGASLFLVMGPLVHAIQERPAQALLSFGLRATIPASVGLLVGLTLAHSGEPDPEGLSPIIGEAFGFIAGGITAVVISIIDMSVMGWKQVPAEPPVLAPAIAVDADGTATFGLSGVF